MLSNSEVTEEPPVSSVEMLLNREGAFTPDPPISVDLTMQEPLVSAMEIKDREGTSTITQEPVPVSVVDVSDHPGEAGLELSSSRKTLPKRTRVSYEYGDDVATDAVMRMPLSVRLNFRLKMLGLIWLNSCGMIAWALFFAYVPAVDAFIEPGRDSWLWGGLFLMFASMGFMVAAKEMRYPNNYIALFAYTFFAGFWWGITTPRFGSHANWQVLGYINGISLCYMFFATLTTIPSCAVGGDTEEHPEPLCAPGHCLCGLFCDVRPRPGIHSALPGDRRILLSLPGAAFCAWGVVFAVSLQGLVSGWLESDTGTFVFLHVCSFFLSWFFAHDTLLIESRTTVDDYMEGVVHFWGDMVICFWCCICMLGTGLLGGCVTMAGR